MACDRKKLVPYLAFHIMTGFSSRQSNEIKTVDAVLLFYAVGAWNK
jgi:hypothetical protein